MNYNDIILLPHHVSQTRPRMSKLARAAQFAPFAALTGFDEIIEETAKTNEERALSVDSLRLTVDGYCAAPPRF